jgi:hypothetical protein
MEQNAYTVGQENFNLPHDVVQLPTGGIFYKSKKKSVKVGYLTANDENFLVSVASQPGSSNNIVLSLLRNKVYEHDIRPDEMLEGDIEAILIFLRNTSFGPEYKISLIDPKSGKPFETEILLDELNIKRIPNTPDENGMFTTTLPRSGSTVKLKPLTYGEIMEIERMSEQYPAGRIAPKVTWRLERQIQEVDGNSDTMTISQFVSTLPIMDSKHIRNFMRENQISLDLRRQVMAPSGELVSFEITFGAEFFRPFF